MRISRLSATLACTAALLVCAHAQAGEEVLKLDEGPGHDVVTTGCVLCHSLDYIQMDAPVMTRARWEATVRKMIDKFGAPISSDDAKVIVDYLSAHYVGAQQ